MVSPIVLNKSFITQEETEEEVIGNKYKIIYTNRLGYGGFGKIYEGEKIGLSKKVAIKVEDTSTSSQLQCESKILHILQGGVGIPDHYSFLQDYTNNYLVMELLGRNLYKLFIFCKKKFTLKTILTLSYQMLARVEYLHSKCVIHRDIKPENFLMGTGDKSKMVYIIDFGLSKRYKDPKTGEHISFKNGKSMIGTSRFASLYTHLGIEQTRRDDIESLAFTFFYFLRGNLPWEGIRGKTKKDKHAKMMQKKLSVSIEELCEGYPEEYGEILNYARSLQFEESPSYKYIRKLIDSITDKFGIEINDHFDWENIDLKAAEELYNKEKKERRK